MYAILGMGHGPCFRPTTHCFGGPEIYTMALFVAIRATGYEYKIPTDDIEAHFCRISFLNHYTSTLFCVVQIHPHELLQQIY